MTPTRICIVARPMSRSTGRRRIVSLAFAMLTMIALFASLGCEQLDGRSRVRKGNRSFRETLFIDAVAEYEKALTEVDVPAIHYNAGLAYSKVFKPGLDKPVRLGVKGTFVCEVVPNTKTVSARVCL